MSERKKVSVVIGKSISIGELDVFDKLTEYYDISLCMLEDKELIKNYTLSMKLKVFSSLEDMPGYFRGLEEQIQESDCILSFGISRLSSFQAVRAGLKLKKPIIIVADEQFPVDCTEFPNIKAIQADILKNADFFISTSSYSEDLLRMEGVDKEKIYYMKPFVSGHRFQFSKNRREKFRDHVGINENDIVVLSNTPLEVHNRPQELLQALRFLQTTSSEVADRVKLLFVGDGNLAGDLKYQASDFGLANKVMFLHQDSTSFARDLYCASDILVDLRKYQEGYNTSLPRWIIEAMACGVMPIVSSSTLSASLVGDMGVSLTRDHFRDVANAITEIVGNKEPGKAKENLQDSVIKAYGSSSTPSYLGKAIDGVWSQHIEGYENKHNFSKNCEEICDQIKEANFSDALINIEDLLLRVQDISSKRAEVLRLKGDLLLKMGRLDESTQCYGECTELDNLNWKGFLGLANVAFLSHSHEEAFTFYKKVLAKDANNPEALLGLGLVYRQVGKIDESIYWLSQSLSLNPSDSKALFSLTQSCLESEYISESVEVLEKVRHLVGDSPKLLMALGQLYIREGKAEEGRDILSQVFDSESDKQSNT